MGKFFQLSFIFDSYPTEIHLMTFYLILMFFIIIFILGIFVVLYADKKLKDNKIISRWFGKIANWSLWCGVIGALLSFFRYQRIPYLGMRFWLMIWLLITFAWLVFVVKYRLIYIPKHQRDIQQKKEFLKYLPK